MGSSDGDFPFGFPIVLCKSFKFKLLGLSLLSRSFSHSAQIYQTDQVSFGDRKVIGRPSDANTWFAVLQAAREASDHELERMARRELEALGYGVVCRRPKPESGFRKEMTDGS